jgi:hypothetical protein
MVARPTKAVNLGRGPKPNQTTDTYQSEAGLPQNRGHYGHASPADHRNAATQALPTPHRSLDLSASQERCVAHGKRRGLQGPGNGPDQGRKFAEYVCPHERSPATRPTQHQSLARAQHRSKSVAQHVQFDCRYALNRSHAVKASPVNNKDDA